MPVWLVVFTVTLEFFFVVGGAIIGISRFFRKEKSDS